jgi:hypothetical protein
MTETYTCPVCHGEKLSIEEIKAHEAAHAGIKPPRTMERIAREINLYLQGD